MSPRLSLGPSAVGGLSDALRRCMSVAPELHRDWGSGHVQLTVIDGYELTPVRWTPYGPDRVWVFTEPGAVLIGPFESPDSSACGRCAERRRANAAGWAEGYERAMATFRARPLRQIGPEVYRLILTLASEIARSRAGESVVRLDLGSLRVTRHSLLRDPLCERCSTTTDDKPPRGAPLRAGPLVHADRGFRALRLEAELDRLRQAFVDPLCGIITKLTSQSSATEILATARLSDRSGMSEAGYGRSTSVSRAEATAIMEALERFSGSPGDSRKFIEASLTSLGDRAIDPRELGVHHAREYSQPTFGYSPFDPDEVYKWAWGWSPSRSEPVLIPATLAYWAAPTTSVGNSFVYETSNGCAIGGSYEEAALFALLEVVERDSFLAAWYIHEPVREIELKDPKSSTASAVAAVEQRTGYRIRAFDVSQAHGIPAVWMLAHTDRTDRPASLSTAGAHVGGQGAVGAALTELVPLLDHQIREYGDQSFREHAHRLATDPDSVRQMSDHRVLFCDPIAADHLSFLLQGQLPTVRIEEVGRPLENTGWRRVGSFAAALVDRLASEGMEVVLFDQTAPELARHGLRVVKAIVVGSLSMTFGQQHRRTLGVKPLERALRARGLTTPHDFPHPFP